MLRHRGPEAGKISSGCIQRMAQAPNTRAFNGISPIVIVFANFDRSKTLMELRAETLKRSDYHFHSLKAAIQDVCFNIPWLPPLCHVACKACARVPQATPTSPWAFARGRCAVQASKTPTALRQPVPSQAGHAGRDLRYSDTIGCMLVVDMARGPGRSGSRRKVERGVNEEMTRPCIKAAPEQEYLSSRMFRTALKGTVA